MTDEEAVAEAREFNAQLEELSRTLPKIQDLPPEVTRQARRKAGPAFPAPVYLDDARMISVPGRGGDVPVRILAPAESRGAYLHLHGGGWTIGAADLQDVYLQAFADATNLTVHSVEYRLAPEHPYPAAPDDCEDVALWLLEQEPGALAIGGESAGAQLAVVTLVRLRDKHGISPRRFAGANLVFGAFDLTGTPSRRLWGERELILSSPLMDWFADQYLPGMPFERRRDPDVSPLYADLSELPPALFTCGLADPLLDDTLFMDARWRAAGNEARVSLWPECAHAFVAFPIELSRRSLAEQLAFLNSV